MTIPEAAIEAGADVARTLRADPLKYPTDALLARSVIEAAMPAIREAIANEIHAALCTDPNCEDVCVGAANAVEVVLEGFEL